MLIMSIAKLIYSYPPRFEYTGEINQETGEMKRRVISTIVEPGTISDVPQKVADEVLPLNAARLPTEIELQLYRMAQSSDL